MSDWSADVCSSDLKGPPSPDRACYPDRISSCRYGKGAKAWAAPNDQRRSGQGDKPIRYYSSPAVAGFASLIKSTALPYGRGLCRSEEHTSELQSLMRTSYAVFCLKKKNRYTETERG